MVGNKEEIAILYGKGEGVLAGVPFVNMVMEEVGCSIDWFVKEGTHFRLDDSKSGKERYVKIAKVSGQANKILTAERVALNLLSNSSGIALKSRRLRDIADRESFAGVIAATRKTIPGFRCVQKYAVLVGGCDAHRMDLSSMIMLKDNAIESCGNIEKAIEKAKQFGGFALKVEVEARNEIEAFEAAKAGADIVMLDNFSPSDALLTSQKLKSDYPHLIIELSGGVTESSLSCYFSPHVDVISTSSLIQSVAHVDFSLKIQPTSLL